MATPEELEAKIKQLEAEQARKEADAAKQLADTKAIYEKTIGDMKTKVDEITKQTTGNQQAADVQKLVAEAIAENEKSYKQKLEEAQAALRKQQVEFEFKAANLKDAKFLGVMGIDIPAMFNADGRIDPEKIKAKIIEAKTTYGYLFDGAAGQDKSVVGEETATGTKQNTQQTNPKEDFKKYVDKLLGINAEK